MTSVPRFFSIASLWLLGQLPLWAQAECFDAQAVGAAEAQALKLFGQAKTFRPTVILHRHHPSHNKEVAVYVNAEGAYYTVILLVKDGCIAYFRKRTRYPKY